MQTRRYGLIDWKRNNNVLYNCKKVSLPGRAALCVIKNLFNALFIVVAISFKTIWKIVEKSKDVNGRRREIFHHSKGSNKFFFSLHHHSFVSFIKLIRYLYFHSMFQFKTII